MFQPTNMLTKRTNMTWVKWLENIDCWPLVRPQVGCLHTQTQTSSWQVMICSPIILLLCAPLLMIDGRNASVGIRSVLQPRPPCLPPRRRIINRMPKQEWPTHVLHPPCFWNSREGEVNLFLLRLLGGYPLVNCYIAMENHNWKIHYKWQFSMGKSTISMAMFKFANC
jgi:hypothetical protein